MWSLSFGFPALLAGFAAAAAPIIIHLLLRPRPRRQVFPAVRLLRLCHSASFRQRTISQWLVLLLRTLLILAIVLAASRPLLRGAAAGMSRPGPVSAIICMDDSASMTYRTADQTRLDRAWRMARELTEDSHRVPAGSRFFLLTGSGHRSSGWHESAASLWRQAPRGAPMQHDRGAVRLLNEAHRLTSDDPSIPIVIYMFTDLTVRAFEGAFDAAALDSPPPTYIIDCGDAAHDNAGIRVNRESALGATGMSRSSSRWNAAVGVPIRLSATATAGDRPLDTQADVWIDGVLATRSAPLKAAPHQTATVTVVLPQLPAGVHRGEARLSGGDAISADDSAYFAFEVAQRARVAIVASSQPGVDVEARRFAALLAPDSLGPDRRPYAIDVKPVEWLDSADLSETPLIVWVEPHVVPASSASRVREWCERGGTLLVVCGPASLRLPRDALAGFGATIADSLPRAGRAAFVIGGASGASDAAQLLRGRHVMQFVPLAPAAAAQVSIRFGDQSPAVIDQQIGTGRAIWWAFSLRPDWSDLGAQAAPILVQLHQIAAAACGGEQRAWNLVCDDPPPRAAWLGAGGLRVTRVAGSSAGDRSATEASAAADASATAMPATALPTNSAGLFRIDLNSASTGSYSVALRASETDGRRLTDEDVTRALAPAPVQIARSIDGLSTNAPGGSGGPLDLEGLAWLLALGLLIFEAALLARAGRATAAPTAPRASSGV